MNKTLFKEFLEDIPEIDTQKEVLVITDIDFFDYIRSHRKEEGQSLSLQNEGV